MQQGEVIGSMEKRGQQKGRKGRNIGHKPTGNWSSLIPLFIEQSVSFIQILTIQSAIR